MNTLSNYFTNDPSVCQYVNAKVIFEKLLNDVELLRAYEESPLPDDDFTCMHRISLQDRNEGFSQLVLLAQKCYEAKLFTAYKSVIRRVNFDWKPAIKKSPLSRVMISVFGDVFFIENGVVYRECGKFQELSLSDIPGETESIETLFVRMNHYVSSGREKFHDLFNGVDEDFISFVHVGSLSGVETTDGGILIARKIGSELVLSSLERVEGHLQDDAYATLSLYGLKLEEIGDGIFGYYFPEGEPQALSAASLCVRENLEKVFGLSKFGDGPEYLLIGYALAPILARKALTVSKVIRRF